MFVTASKTWQNPILPVSTTMQEGLMAAENVLDGDAAMDQEQFQGGQIQAQGGFNRLLREFSPWKEGMK